MNDISLPLLIEVSFDSGADKTLPVLIERWSFSYSNEKLNDSHRTSSSSSTSTSATNDGEKHVAVSYKKTTVLLRTLISKILLLPAHKLFKKLLRLKLSCSKIIYHLKTQPTTGIEFAGPHASFAFSDIWTPNGVFRSSVDYLQDCSSLQPLLSSTGQILITDYDPKSFSSTSPPPTTTTTSTSTAVPTFSSSPFNNNNNNNNNNATIAQAISPRQQSRLNDQQPVKLSR